MGCAHLRGDVRLGAEVRVPLRGARAQRREALLAAIFVRSLIFKNHVYSAEQTDLVLPCSKTYRLDEKFVDTAKNQLLKVRKPCPSVDRSAGIESVCYLTLLLLLGMTSS